MIVPRVIQEKGCNIPPPSLPVDEESAVDTLATDAFGHDAPRDTGFFGPSSNHTHFGALSNAFAQIARAKFPNKQALLRTWTSEQQDELPRNEQPPVPYSAFDPYGMPDEQYALSLFDTFFSSINLVFPYVNKASLLWDYHQARQMRPTQVRRTLRVLLNIIWAHASSSLGKPESEIFYRCAVTLLDTLTIRKTSVELVQIFLLLTIFQQNHQRSVSSWTYHALSVKAAFQLGLHAPSSYRASNEEDKEQRKCIWFGVILQDRILTLSLGRPAMIPEHYNRIEAIRPFSITNQPQSPDCVDNVQFFCHKVSLCSIIYEVLERLYDFNISTDSICLDDLIVARTRLLLRLSAWQSNLGSFSIVKASSFIGQRPEYCNRKRFDIILSIYYHRVAMSINKAVLSRFLTDFALADDEAIPEPIWDGVISALSHDARSAMELQGIFTSVIENDSTFINRYAAWWTANYSVFSTSLHLLGAMIFLLRFPKLKECINAKDIRRSMQQSLDALRTVGGSSLISWKGRNCMKQYIQGYDILANEVESINDGSHQMGTTGPVIGSSLDAEDLNQVCFSSDLAMGSMFDLIIETADDFFAHCTDIDLLQDDSNLFPF
ncbi:hypothetical protein BU24DRAFT_489985 [Aaosphaeria arxii CBS 175.79]|uniref:Xylanolytic transcriptional activator regulatory domain-containing protein n=1 Tax=Aaosphaeria arxii CBS 175.79 TaxID=1450172 RepID=A0A6A5Y4I0_9PLEO|nr:uncharacterized protein BU24DRAFT_489985 [Aaosphaeria arxii CBS 175.79]KAF2020169.1 hypothetical protein BU24DRAFT_489985 [Aaosphaeria arxii CBS 175.79]